MGDAGGWDDANGAVARGMKPATENIGLRYAHLIAIATFQEPNLVFIC